ncbi:unnamed protein product [Amoebophrya sp. A25]|nr:unnamed protein product [Amoebophrya sp. A25]|eukprot:GSA25T00004684001.1
MQVDSFPTEAAGGGGSSSSSAIPNSPAALGDLLGDEDTFSFASLMQQLLLPSSASTLHNGLQNTPEFALLQAFVTGSPTLEEYLQIHQNQGQHSNGGTNTNMNSSTLTPGQLHKFRMLTLLKLAATRERLTFAELQKALCIIDDGGSGRWVEIVGQADEEDTGRIARMTLDTVLRDALERKLISGKIDHGTACLHITAVHVARDVDGNDLASINGMRQVLVHWRERCDLLTESIQKVVLSQQAQASGVGPVKLKKDNSTTTGASSGGASRKMKPAASPGRGKS